jgi:hypothetical protein
LDQNVLEVVLKAMAYNDHSDVSVLWKLSIKREAAGSFKGHARFLSIHGVASHGDQPGVWALASQVSGAEVAALACALAFGMHALLVLVGPPSRPFHVMCQATAWWACKACARQIGAGEKDLESPDCPQKQAFSSTRSKCILKSAARDWGFARFLDRAKLIAAAFMHKQQRTAQDLSWQEREKKRLPLSKSILLFSSILLGCLYVCLFVACGLSTQGAAQTMRPYVLREAGGIASEKALYDDVRAPARFLLPARVKEVPANLQLKQCAASNTTQALHAAAAITIQAAPIPKWSLPDDNNGREAFINVMVCPLSEFMQWSKRLGTCCTVWIQSIPCGTIAATPQKAKFCPAEMLQQQHMHSSMRTEQECLLPLRSMTLEIACVSVIARLGV